MTKQVKNNNELPAVSKTEAAGQKIFAKYLEQNSKLSKAQTSERSDDLDKLKAELSKIKAENFNLKAISALEKSGCLKPELAIKALPSDCENIQEWIDNFKAENDILFKTEPVNHGGSFKPTQCSNLSPVEIMNNYIRGIK